MAAGLTQIRFPLTARWRAPLTARWRARLAPLRRHHRVPARVGVAVPNLRHVEYFHDHQRIEQMFFDGVLHPDDGVLTPDPGQPGLGLTLRGSDAERYRRG